jgi:hypothetical protein
MAMTAGVMRLVLALGIVQHEHRAARRDRGNHFSDRGKGNGGRVRLKNRWHETLLLIEQKRSKACKNAIAQPAARHARLPMRQHITTDCRPLRTAHRSKSSFIRTMTVGSSIELDLLTFHPPLPAAESARGLAAAVASNRLPPVGNSTPP